MYWNVAEGISCVDSILLDLTDTPNAQITSRRVWREYEHFLTCLQILGDKDGEMRLIKSCSKRKQYFFHSHIFKALNNNPTKTFCIPDGIFSMRSSKVHAEIVDTNHRRLHDGVHSFALSLLEVPLVSCRKRSHWIFHVYSTQTAPPDSRFAVAGLDR